MVARFSIGETIPLSRLTEGAAPRLELTVVQEDGVATDRAVVLDGDLVRIGSHPSNDLVLTDSRVSRFHCRLTRGPHAWQVADGGSLNGTAVNGVPVRDADLPAPMCNLELGSSRLKVREIAASAVKYEMLDRPSFGDLYGKSAPMRRLYAVLERVALSDASVLIEGESGTGKELVATEIVRRGARAKSPFVIVDCSAIAPSLIESELFGHVRGAFTGAERDRTGAFEAASGGTIFLDEIGELPLELQPKLLRALESREVRRVGDQKVVPVDVRVVAATNRSLEREVNQGRFREDLFFRLSVVTVRVPPLRERLDDLELLVHAMLENLGALGERRLFTPAVFEDLARYDWPGNVRELRNYVERSVVLQTVSTTTNSTVSTTTTTSESEEIDVEVPFKIAKGKITSAFERRYLTALMTWAEGNVSAAARKAKMDRMNLYRLIQRYDIKASFRD